MKPKLVFATMMAGLIAAPLSYGSDRDDDWREPDWRASVDYSRIRIGYAISPVRLSLRGRNWALVGLGSYIVNAQGGCNDCHTYPAYAPDGDPFKGMAEKINADQYMTGGRQFGPFTSPNLTPDEEGRPAGLSYKAFKTALRTGKDPDDATRILQVMPWPVYGKMSERDLRAIYEYLSAIPSRPDNPSPGP